MALRWLASKDPDDVKDYQADWGALLDSAPPLDSGDCDRIVASEWTVADGLGLVIEETSFNLRRTSVWLSAGTAGTTYQVRNRVTTEGGRQYDQTFLLTVETR